MNLYRSLGRIWTGTQADAKAAQGGKDFEHIDVPTDKAGLIAFLNEMEARLAPAAGGPETAGDFEADPDRYDAENRLMKPHGDPLHEPDRPYQNGHPTTEHMKSRDPAAKTICVICGRTPEQAERASK